MSSRRPVASLAIAPSLVDPFARANTRADHHILPSLSLRVGTSLGDGSNVLAKLAETGSAGALILEREVFLLARLGQNLEASAKTMRVVD